MTLQHETQPIGNTPLGKRHFSFAVIADTHLNQDEAECNSPFEVNRLANGRMRQVVRELNQRELAFVVSATDADVDPNQQLTFEITAGLEDGMTLVDSTTTPGTADGVDDGNTTFPSTNPLSGTLTDTGDGVGYTTDVDASFAAGSLSPLVDGYDFAVDLGITLENLISAESSIRDADFAYETSQLTRNQVLVNSGTTALALANQTPQMVLQLLGG